MPRLNERSVPRNDPGAPRADDLVRVLQVHVPYELMMLREVNDLISDCAHETRLRDALMEALCVHCRVLRDFFMRASKRYPRDVFAQDFSAGFAVSDIARRLFKDFDEKIDTQIMHLSLDRQPRWALKETEDLRSTLVISLLNEAERWAGSLDEPYARHREVILQASGRNPAGRV